MIDVIYEKIAIIGGTVAAIAGIRVLFKKPEIIFSLKRNDIELINENQVVKISLLTGLIGNKKRFFLGDIAKKVTGSIMIRSPPNDDWPGLDTGVYLPWMKPYGENVKIDGQLSTEEDIQKALEINLFSRTEKDIPQGRGETLAVIYGVETFNKMYVASNPPIEIPLPESSEVSWRMQGIFFRLEVVGENLPSTMSKASVIFSDSWTHWSVPAKMTTRARH
jgi:hypothetical protein